MEVVGAERPRAGSRFTGTLYANYAAGLSLFPEFRNSSECS